VEDILNGLIFFLRGETVCRNREKTIGFLGSVRDPINLVIILYMVNLMRAI